MIRFAWVQVRVQTLIVAAALAAIAIALAVSGPHLIHLYNTSVAGCSARGDCSAAITQYLHNDSALRNWLGLLVGAGPGLLGIFWGAPLVARELEAGTFRLAWTQSVTRRRWLVVKLVLVGALSMAAVGLLSLMVTWWASPLDRANMDIYNTFDERDIVPIGFALFAFVLGAAAGLIFRRVVPAMAATLVAFVGARLAISKWVQPNLISPLHRSDPLTADSIVGYGTTSIFGSSSLQIAPPSMPNSWIYSTRLVDSSGHSLTPAYLRTACPGVVNAGGGGDGPGGVVGIGIGSSGSHTEAPPQAQERLHQCGAKVAAVYHDVITYQPSRHYWDLQWIELAIYTAGALALASLCVWWIHRRLT